MSMNDSDNLVLDNLDGYQFEDLIGKIMKKKGYQNIIVTQRSGDMGKDIIMEDSDGSIVVVECKHQSFVGRPVVQKLQGALSHEQGKTGKNVKGIIVTSGDFSPEAISYVKQIREKIELINGKKLKKLSEELNIVILNGKVQIITNKSFEYLSENEAKEFSSKCFSDIDGGKSLKHIIRDSATFLPICYLRYDVEFTTNTSVGCIDEYNESDHIIMDGSNGKEIDASISEFFFKDRFNLNEIKERYRFNKKPYEFTEHDIEEHAITKIVEEHTHMTYYRGGNNRFYSKQCIPKKRDIDIKEFIPIYLPVLKNTIDVKKQQYIQEFYSKNKDKMFIRNELKICKICKRERDDYDEMSLCIECGRIVCNHHTKIDYLDKETCICTIHAKPFKLFLQNKYFAYKQNVKKYESQWKKMNFFRRLYEDKIVFSIACFASLSAIGLIIANA